MNRCSEQSPTNPKPLLISCGILQAEIESLISQGQIQADALFLSRYLHMDYRKLHKALEACLRKNHERNPVVCLLVRVFRVFRGYFFSASVQRWTRPTRATQWASQAQPELRGYSAVSGSLASDASRSRLAFSSSASWSCWGGTTTPQLTMNWNA